MNCCNTAPTREQTTNKTRRPQYRSGQDEGGATLEIALPGVRKEDLKLTLHETRLRIEGTRTDGTAGYGLEIQLTRRLDGTKTTASLEAGVLSLKVPVKDEAKPREIAVN